MIQATTALNASIFVTSGHSLLCSEYTFSLVFSLANLGDRNEKRCFIFLYHGCRCRK